jgi:hypothetical protein
VGVIGDGGAGGDGGDGGDGGSGSGGSGGPSYAIVFSGSKPIYDLADSSLVSGKGGAPGTGGMVNGAKAPDGSTGASAQEFEAP